MTRGLTSLILTPRQQDYLFSRYVIIVTIFFVNDTRSVTSFLKCLQMNNVQSQVSPFIISVRRKLIPDKIYLLGNVSSLLLMFFVDVLREGSVSPLVTCNPNDLRPSSVLPRVGKLLSLENRRWCRILKVFVGVSLVRDSITVPVQ